MNEKLEALKNALVCLCLVVVLFTSCRRDKSTTALLAEIERLQMVVQEVVSPTGASDTPTVKDDIPTDAHDIPTNMEEL